MSDNLPRLKENDGLVAPQTGKALRGFTRFWDAFARAIERKFEVIGSGIVVAVSGSGIVRTLVAGAGISITNADGSAGDPTIATTIMQYTDENAEDAVGGILTDTATIDFTYNDGANTITADVKTASITEAMQVLANNTTNDVSITKHGYAPILPNDSTKFLNGVGGYTVPPGSGSYTDEQAQDAVGAMVDSTLVYVDATPLLTRAALTGDITAPQASNVTTLATVNGNVGSFTGANITVNAKGLITAASNGSGTSTTDAAQDLLWFGAGTDGDVTISAPTTTLTRDMYYHDLTINGTAVLNVNGFKVFVSGTLDVSSAPAGSISASGSAGGNASTVSGGSQGSISTPAAATLGNFYNGGSGASGGTGAGGQGNADGTTAANAHGGKAGEGGAGGSAGSGAGSSRGATSPVSPQAVDVRRLMQEMAAFLSGTWTRLSAGGGAPGGSSGSGDGAGTIGGSGGGGGSGGNDLYVAARTIAKGTSATASIFKAVGGNGGNGSVGQGGTNRGGGGGGAGAGGGWIYLVYRTLTGSTITGALDATGGNGGAGANGSGTGNGGDGGGTGGGGRIDKYDLGAGTSTIVEIVAPTTGNAHVTVTGGAAKTATAQKADL